MADFKAAVTEVKLAYDLVDYIQQAGIALKPSGANKFKGLCPFHQDRTPSMIVDAGFQNYKCWVCAASGDILSFVQNYEHMEFFDALKKLAEDKNIKLDIKEERSGIDYSSLREAMRAVSNFYVTEYRKLDPEHPARNEVRKRGLSEKKMLYGYAPEGRQSLYNHLKEKGFTDETILLTGACVQYDKKPVMDFWHGRLMFFFTDITGKPLGWSGRKLYETDPKPGKYVNSRDGVLFDKSAILYNILKAKKKAAEEKEVFVAEGQLDVATFVEVDKENTVAASGTAFTDKQAMILRRLVGEDGRIIFCFDGDEAGRKAAVRVFTSVPLIHDQAYAIAFPEGEDPDDYRRAHGNEALLDYLANNRVPLVEFVLNLTKKDFDLTDEMSSSHYVSSAAKILRTLSSPILRERYTKHVSLESFTGIDAVRRAVQEATPLTSSSPSAVESPAEKVSESPAPESEEELAFSQLVERIEYDPVYSYSARLASLSLQSQFEPSTIEEVSKLVPSQFSLLLAELAELSPEEPRIPERFSDTELVHYLIGANFFPFAHLMDEDMSMQHFLYLKSLLVSAKDARVEKTVRSKIASVLQRSPDQGAEFLAKALEAEARELSKLSQRS